MKKETNKVYGYVRISTPKQNLERQIRNIKNEYPNAIFIKEVYTGAITEDRPELEDLLKKVKKGDVIVFDSVSRMSRNAKEGFKLYKKLYEQGIELVFLKESYINTETYKKTLGNQVQMTNTNADVILKAVNEYLMLLAEEQIKQAFLQSEKELMDIRQRTKESLITAKNNGKTLGRPKNANIVTKKEIESKKLIKKYCKTFGGVLNDKETMNQINATIKISRVSYYKYKKELLKELAKQNEEKGIMKNQINFDDMKKGKELSKIDKKQVKSTAHNIVNVTESEKIKASMEITHRLENKEKRNKKEKTKLYILQNQGFMSIEEMYKEMKAKEITIAYKTLLKYNDELEQEIIEMAKQKKATDNNQ